MVPIVDIASERVPIVEARLALVVLMLAANWRSRSATILFCTGLVLPSSRSLSTRHAWPGSRTIWFILSKVSSSSSLCMKLSKRSWKSSWVSFTPVT